THVFLYRDNGTSREYPAAWPGVAVADPEIAFDHDFNFVYESSRNVTYKVIFNFVTDSGEIITMAASDSDKGINARGWDAQGSFSFSTSHQLIP
ncbi:MAG: hypothetical protein K2H35_08225, partial [Muribaculaceae bacterium]|nr:hypothetical protein [Muribaculaceae bacterium]